MRQDPHQLFCDLCPFPHNMGPSGCPLAEWGLSEWSMADLDPFSICLSVCYCTLQDIYFFCCSHSQNDLAPFATCLSMSAVQKVSNSRKCSIATAAVSQKISFKKKLLQRLCTAEHHWVTSNRSYLIKSWPLDPQLKDSHTHRTKSWFFFGRCHLISSNVYLEKKGFQNYCARVSKIIVLGLAKLLCLG